MTTDMMNFRDLVEKAPDADLLREMICFAAERLMELEAGAVTGAAYGEKDPARRAQRNGYPTVWPAGGADQSRCRGLKRSEPVCRKRQSGSPRLDERSAELDVLCTNVRFGNTAPQRLDGAG